MSNLVRQSVFHRCGFALALAALLANAMGCVQRRFTIRSNPPGAQVYVDDYEIGTTPCSHDFTYYGTRKVRLVKDGYETLTVYQPMPTPWYQFPGLDFFSDNLWPHEIRDERSFNYQMQPMIDVPTDQLVGRAEQLRAAGRAIPAAAVAPVATPPVVTGPPIVTQPTDTLPAPAPNLIAPPPVGAPPSSYLPPPTGAAPNYGVPGGYLPGSAAPLQNAPPSIVLPPATTTPSGPVPSYGVPGANPTGPIMPSQPALPPGWRPISETPPGPEQPVRR